MKKNHFFTVMMFLLTGIMTLQAQTARNFTINLTEDGKANMVVFLPEKPSGRAIVGVPTPMKVPIGRVGSMNVASPCVW